MTDGEAFLLVFVLIYLSDCLVWLPPSGYALIAFWSRGHAVRRAAVQFSALKKGFAVLQPLPPFGSVFVSQAWPVSLTTEGVAPFSRDNPNPGPPIAPFPDATFLPWESVEKIGADGAQLRINGKTYAQCAGSASARWLAAAIRTVKEAAPEIRAEAIGKIVRRSLDERRAERRARFFRRAAGSIRISSITLFLAVFFLLPFTYWRYHDEPPFFLVLGAAWLLMLQVTVEYWRIHRRFYPTLSPDRWEHATLSLLFPQYAIRSVDALSKGFLAESHPVAIAAAIARPDEYARLAEFAVRDARNPIPLAEPSSSAGLAAESFRSRFFLPALEALLERVPPTPHPPEALPDSAAVCPRCGTGFEAPGLSCHDCGGLTTIPVTLTLPTTR